MSNLLFDCRAAFRSLLKSGGFTSTTLLLLAFGIGTSAAVLTVVDDVLIAPLDFREPENLVAVWPGSFVSYREVEFLEESGRDLESVGAVSPGWGTVLAGGREPAQLTASRTTPNLFSTLGVAPILGRVFTEEEYVPGRHQVTMLSHATWQRYFGADPAVIGRSVQLDGEPHQIVGVMPADFQLFGLSEDLWTPLPVDRSVWYWEGSILLAAGRLSGEATPASAETEFRGLLSRMREEFDLDPTYGENATVAPLQSAILVDARPVLQALLVTAGLILLLVVTTASNLFVARAAARRKEVAIRAALGSSGARLIGQSLLEAALLCGTAAVIALIVATGASRFLVALLATLNTPRLAEVQLGAKGMLIVVLVSGTVWTALSLTSLAGTAVGRNLAPQLLGSRSSSGRIRTRLRGALVTAQFALATMLVIAAGLMVRSVVNLYQVDPGLRVAGVETFQLQASMGSFGSPEAVLQFYDQVRDGLLSNPAVESLGLIQHLPMTSVSWSTPLDEVEGRPFEAGQPSPRVGWRVVGERYFETLGVPLVRGRLFTQRDTVDTEPVVLVNQAMAERFWPGENPVGARLRAGNATRRSWARVVGVVGNVRYTGLDNEAPAALYRPHRQYIHAGMTFVVRTADGSRIPTEQIQRLVWGFSPDVPVSRVLLMGEILNDSIAGRRLVMLLLVTLGAAGLLLGALGLYGVLSFVVRQRRQELGVRLALGARPGSVVALIMKDGLAKGLLGSALGLAAAVVWGRLLENLLFQVDARDWVTMTAVPLLLIGVAGLASWLPARRTVADDPMTALNRPS